jgi:hypothetical protein
VKQTGDHRLVKARAEFDAAVPHAKDFRDFLEHLDVYLREDGGLQKSGEVAKGVDLEVEWGRHTGRVTLRLGEDHTLDLEDAVEAAFPLAEVTTTVWFDQVMKGMKSPAARASSRGRGGSSRRFAASGDGPAARCEENARAFRPPARRSSHHSRTPSCP